jgi:hypothetical protein
MDFVTLTLRDGDDEMGFPGNLEITCKYRLKPDGVLSTELSAATDQPTLCNLAQHSYFNLDDGGASDALDHRLEIDAGAFLLVDDELIPTGFVTPVGGTDFDFRAPRAIRREVEGKQIEYDHNWCLAAAPRPCRRVARLCGAHSGVSMEVWTTDPAFSSMPATRWRATFQGWEAANTGRSRAFALNRRSGRIRRTIPISRRQCSAQARRTDKSRSTISPRSFLDHIFWEVIRRSIVPFVSGKRTGSSEAGSTTRHSPCSTASPRSRSQ